MFSGMGGQATSSGQNELDFLGGVKPSMPSQPLATSADIFGGPPKADPFSSSKPAADPFGNSKKTPDPFASGWDNMDEFSSSAPVKKDPFAPPPKAQTGGMNLNTFGNKNKSNIGGDPFGDIMGSGPSTNLGSNMGSSNSNMF